MSGIYVTGNGFMKKTLEEIKAEEEAKFITQFGDDIDLDPEAPFGQIIGLNVKAYAELWDALQEIYTSRNINEATNYSLDSIVGEVGIIRQISTPTKVQKVFLTGDNGTIITSGLKVRRQNSDDVYSNLNSVILQPGSDLGGITFELDDNPVIVSKQYDLSINGTTKIYIAQSGDLPGVVWSSLFSQFTPLNILDSITGDDGEFAKLESRGVDYNTFTSTSTTANAIQIRKFGTFENDLKGVHPLPATTLTEIVNPVSGWDSVTNPLAGITGRDAESDEDLRKRQKKSLNTGLAVEGAILRAILEVPGVAGASVTSNRTLTIQNGIPPKAFESVVNGGDVNEVALAIWNAMPAGIQPFGVNQSITIIDSQGNDQLIEFSTPTSVFLHIEIKINKYNEEIYPVDGDNLMKQAVEDFANEEFALGVDVVPQRFNQPIYSINGVGQTQIRCALTANIGDTPVFPIIADKDNLIPIDGRTLAVTDVSIITIADLV